MRFSPAQRHPVPASGTGCGLNGLKLLKLSLRFRVQSLGQDFGFGVRVGFRVWGKGVQDFALPVQGFGMPRYANLP